MEAEVINTVVNSPNTIEILLRASGPLFGLLVLIGVFLTAHKYIPQMISSFNGLMNEFNGLTSEVKLMRETLSNMSQRVEESEENAVTITKRLDAIEMTLKKINEDITEIRIENKIKGNKYAE